jgi:predicted protein tyrosine phosphatase
MYHIDPNSVEHAACTKQQHFKHAASQEEQQQSPHNLAYPQALVLRANDIKTPAKPQQPAQMQTTAQAQVTRCQ